MAITAVKRINMINAFKTGFGDEVTETLMEHLPPEGWGDVVRVHQLGAVEERLDARITNVEKSIKHLTAGMWALAGIMAAGFFAIFNQLSQLK